MKLTVSVSDSTDNPLVHAAVDAAGITYTEAATAEIGNHIQLRKFWLADFPWNWLDVLRIGKQPSWRRHGKIFNVIEPMLGFKD